MQILFVIRRLIIFFIAYLSLLIIIILEVEIFVIKVDIFYFLTFISSIVS